MKIEVKDFDYTMNEALIIAKRYYEENGNREEVHKEFQHCQLSEVIACLDEYSTEYSNVKMTAFTKLVDVEGVEESFFDVSFIIKLTEKELKIAIEKFAKILYESSVKSYKRKVYKQVQDQLNHIVTKEI